MTRLADSAIGRALDARTEREKALLIASATLTGLAVAYTQLWQPIVAVRDSQLATIARYDQVLQAARTSGPLFAPALAQDVPIADVVANSAPGFDLLIRRIEADGQATRVTLEQVAFEPFLLWLQQLTLRNGLRAIMVELERQPEPGIVSARLVLEK